MFLFLIAVLTVLVLGYFYLSRRLIAPLALGGRATFWLNAALLFLFVLQMTGPILGRVWNQAEEPLWLLMTGWLSFLVMGFIAIVFFLLIFRDSVLLVAWLFKVGDPAELARYGSMAVAVLGVVLCAAGVAGALAEPRIEHVTVEVKGLPGALDGFRIVQVSDLHLGPTIKAAFSSALVERINALSPDVVAITGDVADGYPHLMHDSLAPLSGLKARHGVFVVTGNHEYYWGGVGNWVAEFTRLGMTVLINENRLINVDGAKVAVAGVTDTEGGHFDPGHVPDAAKAIAGAEGADFRVLLSHQPRAAGPAAKAGFNLLLCGHTHGGQFIPWNLLVRLQQPFVSGLNRLGGLVVYVSRGAGYWGPPLRLGVPSEITVVVLKAERAGSS
jgi:hypothetical protein